MGSIEQGGISPSGETLQNSSPHPAEAGLSRFRNHSLDVLNRFGTRLALAALALAAPFTAAPQARAEDNQPGVKPEGITIIVDDNPVEISGVQAGGEEPAADQPGDPLNLEGQGGGVSSPDTAIAAELFETTPQGRLTTPKLAEGEVGWKPRVESATDTDGFLGLLNAKIKIINNPLLRGGIGTNPLYPDLNNRRTPETYGRLNTFVDPDDPRTLIVESNILRPGLKLDPTAKESLERQAAGNIGSGLSKVIYGKSMLDGLTQGQADHIGQLAVRFMDEIRPFELVTPTVG